MIIIKNEIGNQTYPVNFSPSILWWYNLNAPSFGSAAVGDLDGDTNLEIVFGTYFNDEKIYALNAETGSLLWSYDTGGCNDASPAIADVDLDGELEVIVPASSPYKVYCFNGETGAVKWSRSTGYPNCIDSPPAVADVDNDDKPEVIFGTFYGYVFCLNGEDGSIAWQINLGTDSYIQSEPNILDLNNDGQLDIVVAQYDGDCRIYALNGDNGSILWYCDEPQDFMYHGGSFGDIDEDGKPEIVIGSYDSHIYVLNGEDGSVKWEYIASYYIAAPTSIADLNNDGHLEIVFASYNIIGVLSHTGGLLWTYPTGGSIFRGSSIADVDGDGVLDVAFGSSDGILRVLKGNSGQVVWTYDLQAHYGNTFDIDNAPVIADFNGDGKLDIFVVGGYGASNPPTNNHGRAYALTAGDGTGTGWLMFRNDLVHSGCFGSNQPPSPPTINGPNQGVNNVEYEFTFFSTDPENDNLFYYIDWNDGFAEEWIGPYSSSEVIEISHTWDEQGIFEIKAKTKDTNNREGPWSDPFEINILENSPPTPPTIDGNAKGKVGVEYNYSFLSTDADNNEIYYYINWGDGNIEQWIGPYYSAQQIILNHSWMQKGTYIVKVKAKDIYSVESQWSELLVKIPRTRNSYNWIFLKTIKNLLALFKILF
jgi:outer membrane protein assembly factor BamB